MARAPDRFRSLRKVGLLASHRRGQSSDRRLALVLAATAGCANAGGFMALGHYTSHMTGYLSQFADNIALWNLRLMGQSLLAIGLFIAGAASSSLLINWARHNSPRRQYSLPVATQGVLFLCLASLGAPLAEGPVRDALALGLLCFIMGLQNATITKLSGARIRTTHATGMITDVGIEVGRAAYGRMVQGGGVSADRYKLGILLRLLAVFVLGGVAGAFGYAYFGLGFSALLASALLIVSLPAMR